ncbi:hypothetical protein [Streptomyces sp. NPDC002851]
MMFGGSVLCVLGAVLLYCFPYLEHATRTAVTAWVAALTGG